MNSTRILLLPGLALLTVTSCGSDAGNSVKQSESPSASIIAADNPVGPIPGPEEAELPSNPFAGDQNALRQGRKLFVDMNCSGCHGGHGGGGMGPSLRDRSWIYGDHQADIFDSIYEGRAHGMPAWGSLLPEDYIWKIAAYIGSMRTADEPDPPRRTEPRGAE